MENCKKSLVTLTPAESKRLIAKYIAQMPIVKKAMEKGIISVQLSSSNGYVREELSGKKINKNAHMCGCISAGGGCATYLPDANKRESYFVDGVEKHWNFPLGNYVEILEKMGEGDILIKSGNLLDCNGKAAVFVGEPSGNGGEWGVAYEYVKKNNITVIAPMTLNKAAHVTIEEICDLVKVNEIDWDRTHIMADVVPLPGIVVTEIDAIKGFFNVEAKPVAMSGVDTGEGTAHICIYGNSAEVEKAWDFITSIKGEPKLEVNPRCGECLALRNHGLCVAQKRTFTRR